MAVNSLLQLITSTLQNKTLMMWNLLATYGNIMANNNDAVIKIEGQLTKMAGSFISRQQRSTMITDVPTCINYSWSIPLLVTMVHTTDSTLKRFCSHLPIVQTSTIQRHKVDLRCWPRSNRWKEHLQIFSDFVVESDKHKTPLQVSSRHIFNRLF